MQSFFGIEVDATHRQSEMQRAAAADARAAQARQGHGRVRWPHLPCLLLSGLRSSCVPRMRLSDIRKSGAEGRSMTRLAGALRMAPVAERGVPR
jgi:hypothetical protein